MIADATLIVLPLHTIRFLHGNSSLRRRLQVIFMASALTTMASIINAGFNLSQLEFGLLVAAEMEVRLIPNSTVPSYRTFFRRGSRSLSLILVSLLRPALVTLDREHNPNHRSQQIPEERTTRLLACKYRWSSSAVQQEVSLKCTELIQNLT
jgi:hypothetical protein